MNAHPESTDVKAHALNHGPTLGHMLNHMGPLFTASNKHSHIRTSEPSSPLLQLPTAIYIDGGPASVDTWEGEQHIVDLQLGTVSCNVYCGARLYPLESLSHLSSPLLLI